jgi:hypothetical protein
MSNNKLNGLNIGFFLMLQLLWVNAAYYFFIICNKGKMLINELEKGLLIYNGFVDDDAAEKEVTVNVSEPNSGSEKKVDIKYEDKYLDAVNKMSMEYSFSVDEAKIIEQKTFEFLDTLRADLTAEKEQLNLAIVDKGLEYIDVDEFETCENMENARDELGAVDDNLYIKQKKIEMLSEIDELRSQVTEIAGKIDNYSELHADALEQATRFVIKERLDGFKNSFIIEKTPLGNVIMYYNNNRSSFEYYTDNTIPYRFLETVGRKYVTVFNCKQIYVDMANELKESERKLKESEEKEKEKEREKEEREKREINDRAIGNDNVAKKNVFTKFKSYNKESGTGRVNKGAPPKNSIPNNGNYSNSKNSTNAGSDKVLLKENSNRYTCIGRIANFNILKKVDRKNVDKKYAMTFADFKKLKENIVK